MAELPSGTVTFLFTDLEGSTRLWEEHPEAMREALTRHDELLREAVETHGGRVVKTTGDGLHAAFGTADSAVMAALDAQLALESECWRDVEPLSVRMGLHTGTAEQRGGDYYGSVLNRAARLMSAAHGGQVVVSQVTAQLIDDVLPPDVQIIDLGTHRLRDLASPMQVFQLHRPGLRVAFPPLRSLDSAAGNLPVLRTSFVGRHRELERIGVLLNERRLVTLTGVGGVGKTRLALQAAVDMLPAFSGGAWLVELARTTDPDAVGSVVASALGAAPRPGRSDTEVVCAHLGATRAVLVLDNCEHVLDAAAALVEAVLEGCPSVVVLADSREPQVIYGEQLLPVRPLDPITDAVALFAERARAVDPDFELTADIHPAVKEICRRLDGLPLAVELAAARVDSAGVGDIAGRLDDRLRFLSSGRRRSLDRHQTLRATLEWSTQLLNDEEQTLFRRLGVFAGGFPADAVPLVCVFPYESLLVDEVLSSLVRKSLVQFERDPEPGRYRPLEPVRAFALEQLDEVQEAEGVACAHAEWIAQLVDHPLARWYTEDGVDLATIRREFDNWRDAVDYALAKPDPVLALRLTFHTFGAEVPETRRWTEAALALPGLTELPGSYWLHWVALTSAAAEMDVAAVARHVAAFKAGCHDQRDLAWLGAFEAMIASTNGEVPTPALEQRLATPGLSALARADLHLYRSFYRNFPPHFDVDAARLAVRLGADARYVPLPVAIATLAVALSTTDPEASLTALRDADERAQAGGNRFIVASVAAWGARALLSLPDDVVARELLARLDRLQPNWNNAAAVLLTLCVSVLRRVNDPAASILHSYIWTAPGAATTAQSVAPDLPEPDLSTPPPTTFDDTLQLARTALHTLAADTVA